MDLAWLESAVLPHFRASDAAADYRRSPIDKAHVRRYIRHGARRVAMVCDKAISLTGQGARVLEVGTAYGLILLCLRRRGFDVTGTELAANIGVYCRALVDAKVPVGAWDLHSGERPPDDGFDLVIASEVLEHLQINPTGALRQLARATRPGGIIIVTTPNIYCIDNLRRIMRGENICEPFPGEAARRGGVVVDERMHPREPTLKELEGAARGNGMQVVESGYFDARGPGSWRRALVSRFLPGTRDSLLLVARTRMG